MSIETTTANDLPRDGVEEDKLGLKPYEQGLEAFLRGASTPITIALQGEWGSGKTSLMNVLREDLCISADTPNVSGKEFYSVWINTWEFALMKDPQEVLLQILLKITDEVINLSKTKQDVADSIRAGIFVLGAAVLKSIGNKCIDGAGDGFCNAISVLKENSVTDLRNKLQKQINEIIGEKPGQKKGIIFFIDDLDRIDPPLAVELLELLKNLFTLTGCIFVLAIDYDVVIKGLKPKYGELTEKNEREFRSFFDKIIQVPFSMPVNQYRIDAYLMEILRNTGILDSKDLAEDKKLQDDLKDAVKNSIGCNPRSLKRFVNTLSLIRCISRASGESKDEREDTNPHLNFYLNFVIVAIQVAYPKIYRALCLHPDFISWCEEDVRKAGIAQMDETIRTRISEHKEFDEEWEQVLYRICLTDKYLESNAFCISRLFNSVKKRILEEESAKKGVMPADYDYQPQVIGTYISSQMNLTAVTGLTPGDMPPLQYDKYKLISEVISSIVSGLTASFPAITFKSAGIIRTGSRGAIETSYRNLRFEILQSNPENHRIQICIMLNKQGMPVTAYGKYIPKNIPGKVYIDSDLFEMRTDDQYDVSHFNEFFEKADRLMSGIGKAYSIRANRRLVHNIYDGSLKAISFSLQFKVTFTEPDSFGEGQVIHDIQDMTKTMFDTIKHLD